MYVCMKCICECIHTCTCTKSIINTVIQWWHVHVGYQWGQELFINFSNDLDRSRNYCDEDRTQVQRGRIRRGGTGWSHSRLQTRPERAGRYCHKTLQTKRWRSTGWTGKSTSSRHNGTPVGTSTHPPLCQSPSQTHRKGEWACATPRRPTGSSRS